MNYYAHTVETATGEPLSQERWQPLSEHLRNVADKAREFAEPLAFADAAEQAGLLHHFGKYRVPLQEYLAGERSGSVETHHAVNGAALAFQWNWPAASLSTSGQKVQYI